MKIVESIKLKSVSKQNREQFLSYLLLADESEDIVKQYIDKGDMFSIQVGNEIAGVSLFTYPSRDVVELKNIALAPEFRGIGLGKLVIYEACKIYVNKRICKMIVGTANSSIANIAFYQKVGFRLSEIKKNFFMGYPEPIYENGIRALDMVMFEKDLTE
ncbi:GNAT family N-acetyltransferase [Alkalibacillus silvisoli]|uniref:GNAT family N-acetyltransferase n=1 Tax=Alkalibacillus silvisoli TaxID=392823 RepID=A0ABN0ZNL4_9BACI